LRLRLGSDWNRKLAEFAQSGVCRCDRESWVGEDIIKAGVHGL
jgi:hypothetical protein